MVLKDDGSQARAPHFQRLTTEYFPTVTLYGVVSCYISCGTPTGPSSLSKRLGYLWGFRAYERCAHA